MNKALLAAAVAVAALVGVIVAVVVSGSDDRKTAPGSSASSATSGESTGAPTAGGTGGAGTTAGSTGSTGVDRGLPASATRPVEPIALPPPPSPQSPRRRTLIVGVVDDALTQQNRRDAQAQAGVALRAGFDAVVVSATWARGLRRPPGTLVRALRNVAAATKRTRVWMFVLVWHGFARMTPRTPDERADFASFAVGVVKAVPGVRGVIVGNEPNLDTFWKPQFGPGGRDAAARGYEDLLARTYDALKDASPGVRVIGGAVSPRGSDRPHGLRPTHSPTSFIRDLGAAYRASGRDRPLMDAFAFHPYMQASRISPRAAHPTTTSITIADYPKLVSLLNEAFRDTAQRGKTLPILYTEFGVQTRVPADKRSFYEEGAALGSPDAVGFETQADYYRQALALAYCQPTVRGLFVFHVFDESDLDGWQSGLYFADRTPKPSLPGFRRAVADLRAGELTDCR